MRYAYRPVGVEGKQLPQGTFSWSYKGCPCCGRVQPDSRPDDIGPCELCHVPKVLLDGPPEGWFELVNVSPPKSQERQDKPQKFRSKWQLQWENRDPKDYCEHERKWWKSRDSRAASLSRVREIKAS